MKKNFIILMVIMISPLFISCGGGNDNTTDPEDNNTATVSGIVTSITTQSISFIFNQAINQQINVLAVDENANMFKTLTDNNGRFNLELQKAKNYVFLFQRLDGSFLGTLIVNNYTGLKINENLNLGEISIDVKNQKAITNKEQELSSYIEPSLNIKNPEDIKIYPDKTKQVDLSLMLNDIAWIKFSTDGNENKLYINKRFQRGDYIFNVGYSFQTGLTNSQGQLCSFPNDIYDEKCYSISGYVKKQIFANKFKELFQCENLGPNKGGWVAKEINIEIPFLLKIGDTFNVKLFNGETQVLLEKLGRVSSFKGLTSNLNKEVDILLFKLGDRKRYWFIKGFGQLLVTDNADINNPNLIWDNTYPKNPIMYGYAVLNKKGELLYAFKGNFNIDFLQLKNLIINRLPNPFINIPPECRNQI